MPGTLPGIQLSLGSNPPMLAAVSCSSLSWVQFARPGQQLFVIAYRCLQAAGTNFLLAIVRVCWCVCAGVWVYGCAGVCVCVCVMKLMPSRIYITEPPFPCCVYCSCCDKCYRWLTPSLWLSLSLSRCLSTAFSFTHQFNWKASSGLSLLYFVICLLAICHFFHLLGRFLLGFLINFPFFFFNDFVCRCRVRKT